MTDAAHIRFDGWTLTRASGELAREGSTQRLAPQPLAMLVELLEHPGEVVTRERMVQVLWPKGIVDFDNSLNAVVRKLRTVLGDDPEAPRYIETLPRIGYRFVGKIEAAVVAVAPSPPPSPPSPATAAPRSRPKAGISIAVLVALFGAGVAIYGARKDRGPPVTPDAVSTQAAAATPRRTTSERAYDFYLQGIFNRSRRDINGNDLATANFEAALKEDPYYADAWAGLAEIRSGAAMTQYAPTVPTYESAKTAALRALELADGNGHAHAAIAHIYMMYERDLVRAGSEIERARVLEPGYARVWHTRALLRAFQGRLPEALDDMRRAREIEPMNLLYSSNYALLLYHARRYDDAIAHAKLLLASQPRLDSARSLLIRALLAKGDVQAALDQLPLRISEKPNLADAGFVYARAGRRAEALAEIERIERIGKEGFGVGYDVAMIQTALGNLDAACAALERALTDHSLQMLYMRSEPRLDALRQQPCFAQVQRQLY